MRIKCILRLNFSHRFQQGILDLAQDKEFTKIESKMIAVCSLGQWYKDNNGNFKPMNTLSNKFLTGSICIGINFATVLLFYTQ